MNVVLQKNFFEPLEESNCLQTGPIITSGPVWHVKGRLLESGPCSKHQMCDSQFSYYLRLFFSDSIFYYSLPHCSS